VSAARARSRTVPSEFSLQCTEVPSSPASLWSRAHDEFHVSIKYHTIRMWASAQRDSRPAKYRWRPLLDAAKFGRRSLLECRAVTGERKTWTQSEFCTWQDSLTEQEPPKMYI